MRRRMLGRTSGGGCPNYVMGKYTAAQVTDMITNDGYIPVATADEFDKINNSGSQTMGVGTCWEDSYTVGVTQKYVQVLLIDFTSFGVWANQNSGFKGVYDGNDLWLENISQTLPLFRTTGLSEIKNLKLRNASCASPTNAFLVSVGDSTSQVLSNIIIDNCSAETTGGLSACMFSGQGTYTDIKVDAYLTGGEDSAVFGAGGGDFLRIDISGDVVASNSGNIISGFLGNQKVSSTYTECKNNMNVDATFGGNDRIGGFIGVVSGGTCDFQDCSFGGSVNGRNAIAGFIGDYSGLAGSTIDNCIVYGALSAAGALFGGFCSRVLSGGLTATNSYYDTDTGASSSTTGTGKTTSELQTPITNSGIYSAYTIPPWDFGTALEYPTLTTTP